MPKTCNHDGCRNPIFGGGYCLRHQGLRRDKKRPKETQKQRTKIKPVSSKQAIKNQEYKKVRDDYMSRNPLCKAKLLDCTGIATDVHHKRGRGEYLLDTSTWLPVCRNCHQWIETHPAEAKEKGFSESRLQND